MRLDKLLLTFISTFLITQPMFAIMVINHHSEKLAPLAFAVVSVEVKLEQKQQLQKLPLQLNKLATYRKILKLVKQVLLRKQFHPYLPAFLVI